MAHLAGLPIGRPLPMPSSAFQLANVPLGARLAVDTFRALELAGMARVDFFLDRSSGQLFVNEVNTIPGFTAISMYPKMWEASGIPVQALTSRLIDLAMERRRARRALKTQI